MASVLLASCSFRGHVGPTLELAEALVEAGHHVRVVTGRRWAAATTAVGAGHLPLPAEADLDETTLAQRFPGRAGLRGLAAPRFDMTRIFLDPVPGQLAAVDAALAEQTDVVVAEPLFLAAWPLVGRAGAPPVLTLGTMPLIVTNPAMPPAGQPLPLGPLAGPAHVLAHRAAHRVVLGPPQRHGRRVLAGLGERGPGFFLDWPLHGAGIVQLSVPAFEPAALPVPVHHVGSLRRTDGPSAERPPWWDRVEEARAAGVPVVHVTQGTVANHDPGMLLAPTLRALAGRPVLVVATTGGRAVDELDVPVPGNAVVTDWVPYDLLLPATDLFVTNGGYGGVQESLRHGVPVLLVGAQQDKAAVGARVRRSGVGRALATLSPDGPTLDREVGTVLHDPSYRRAARAVAEQIARAPGRAGAVAVVSRAAARRR